MKVICIKNLNDNFKQGNIYDYKIDYIEDLCDEYIHHLIDNISISYSHFKVHFKDLNIWRDEMITALV